MATPQPIPLNMMAFHPYLKRRTGMLTFAVKPYPESSSKGSKSDQRTSVNPVNKNKNPVGFIRQNKRTPFSSVQHKFKSLATWQQELREEERRRGMRGTYDSMMYLTKFERIHNRMHRIISQDSFDPSYRTYTTDHRFLDLMEALEPVMEVPEVKRKEFPEFHRLPSAGTSFKVPQNEDEDIVEVEFDVDQTTKALTKRLLIV